MTQQLSQQQPQEVQQQAQQPLAQQQQYSSTLYGPHSPRSSAQCLGAAKDGELPVTPPLLLSPDVLSGVLARFRSTLRVLLIDTTIRRSPSLFSWLSALLLLVLVPLLVYLGIKPADDLPQHQVCVPGMPSSGWHVPLGPAVATLEETKEAACSHRAAQDGK